MKSFICGLIHYYVGKIKLRRGEYGWAVAEWHFLSAREYLSDYLYPPFSKNSDAESSAEKVGGSRVLNFVAYKYALRCGQLLTMIEGINAKRIRELEKSTAIACWGRRIRREAEKNNGDFSKSNVALFLTYPE